MQRIMDLEKGLGYSMIVKLTQNKVAIVDDDYASVIECVKWYADWIYNGYKARNNELGYMHIYLWEQVVGTIPLGLVIDHINGNGLDNRLENLRLATKRQNAHNMRARRGGTTSSSHVGVYWNKRYGKWEARIYVNHKNRYLGRFENEDDAGRAYQVALEELL